MKTVAYMIIDGQWGSTGKGLATGYFARKNKPDTVVCNFGPNAGHTFVFHDAQKMEQKMIVRQLPNGIVSDSVKHILIGPGSIIDPTIFIEEVHKFSKYLEGKNLVIHPNAAIVGPEHKERERLCLNRISSTCKGTGAALAAKVMREPSAVAGYPSGPLSAWVCYPETYNKIIEESRVIQIESAQGFELSVNGAHYPFCTGRDITPAQILSDTLVPHTFLKHVVVVMRTFPIRVGNAYDEQGNQIGTSGPVYSDQQEVNWESLGVTAERTTVTNKIRRVFTFSNKNLLKVLQVIKPDSMFLNFVNYLDPKATCPGELNNIAYNFIQQINSAATEYCPEEFWGILRPFIQWIGLGPNETDVHMMPGSHKSVVPITTYMGH